MTNALVIRFLLMLMWLWIPEGIAQVSDGRSEPKDASAVTEASLELGHSERRRIQIGLDAAGFDTGPAEGHFGPITRGAIRKWQVSGGARATGYLDVESAKVLLAAGKRREAELARQKILELRRLAAQGDLKARYDLTNMYAAGEGVPRDYIQAYAWLNGVAGRKKGEFGQIVELSYKKQIYLRGLMTTEEALRAEKLSQGDALFHYYGHGVPKNASEAAAWYSLATEAYEKFFFNETDSDTRGRYIEALFSLGRMYDYGLWAPENDVEAAEWYRLAAQQGHVEAQFKLGSLYSSGPQDAIVDVEATEWVRRNIPDGMSVVHPVIVLRPSDVVVTDVPEALKWLRLAAEQGHARAQHLLGEMYVMGAGDDTEAAKWFLRAAEKGLRSAQSQLGLMYTNGIGVPRDPGQAHAWYRKAAERGSLHAQSSLGLIYADGKGVPRDYVQAYAWSKLALTDWWDGDDFGKRKTAELLDSLKEKMTAEQIVEAEELIASLVK